ncbi:MAG TPA: HAD hydrolase-like protein [Methylomirabilota bacterium]|jgi:phosphoglycolate phosphatase|nr:HAD hydrolase-like protein [Methylomirabilota bacterium]
MLPVCAFDLDHTLVRSPLDLAAMRADLRAFAAATGLHLPAEAPLWTVEQTIQGIAREAPALTARCWTIVLDHERRALADAACEPGARETLERLGAAGVALAVWTNNARAATEVALVRCGLRAFFPTVITRDEATMKPDPGGLRLLRAAYPERPIWVVGDSWVDGAAAQAGGAPFIAYGSDPEQLRRRAVVARLVIHDLRELPGHLATLSALAPPV